MLKSQNVEATPSGSSPRSKFPPGAPLAPPRRPGGGARGRGPHDRALNHGARVRTPEAQVDDGGAARRLDGPARAVVRGQSRGIEYPLRHAVVGPEPPDAQNADRADLDRPVDPRDSDAVVAHGADRARDVQTMPAQRARREAGAPGVRD